MHPRTRWIVACFCLPAVAWIVATRTAGQTSQPAAYEVRAQRFVLTDADDKPAIVLFGDVRSIDQAGGPDGLCVLEGAVRGRMIASGRGDPSWRPTY